MLRIDLPVARELRDLKAQTATAANEKVARFDLLVGLLLDGSVADDELCTRAWETMAPERWAAAAEQARAILRPLDAQPLLTAGSALPQLRRFVRAPVAALIRSAPVGLLCRRACAAP